MYSFMGGGLICAGVGNILLIVYTATDYWMQYRQSGNYMHQGLWRYCMPRKCFPHSESIEPFSQTAFNSMVPIFKPGSAERSSLLKRIFSPATALTWGFGIQNQCFLVFLAMAVYTGVTINYYGKRYGNWRFSWSYIIGWVSVVLTFFSGIFYLCAYRMHECPR
ncbi:unnamed protein product, partial [Tetraodon nigroviridis]